VAAPSRRRSILTDNKFCYEGEKKETGKRTGGQTRKTTKNTERAYDAEEGRKREKIKPKRRRRRNKRVRERKLRGDRACVCAKG
jgi:hypothetical protein